MQIRNAIQYFSISKIINSRLYLDYRSNRLHNTRYDTFKRINIRNPVEIPGRDSIERKVITK